MLRAGRNVLALEGFYWNQRQEPNACADPDDADDRGGLLALIHDPDGRVVAATGAPTVPDLDLLPPLPPPSPSPPLSTLGHAGAIAESSSQGGAIGEWITYKRGDAMLRTDQGLVASTDGRYQQPLEGWDASHAPTPAERSTLRRGMSARDHDWRDAEFAPDASEWEVAAARATPAADGAFRHLRSKEALHNALLPIYIGGAPLAVGEHHNAGGAPPSPGASPSLRRLTPTIFVIDLGRERQGGLNVTFEAAFEAAKVRVFAGEELLANGTVKRLGTSSNINDAT